MNKKNLGMVAIALIIGFGAGYLIHAPSTPTGQPMSGNSSGMRGTGAARTMTNGGFLSGTIASKDAGSITLNTRDGSSHVVILTPATTVAKSVSGALTDISVGSTVMVSGTTNSDGSVSATTIQIRPTPPSPTEPN